MNRIFKVIWNAGTGNFCVAGERAKSRGKKTGRVKLILSALLGISGLIATSSVLAAAGNDTGEGVTPPDNNSGTGWVAIGTAAKASTHTDMSGASTAIGYKASAETRWATALGALATASGQGSTAVGNAARSTGVNSLALGIAGATNDYAVAVGAATLASGLRASAFGSDSYARANYALALGSGANVGGEKSVAVGANATTGNTINSVALGAHSMATEDNTVSISGNTVSRRLVNMANGIVSDNSTDAVNGSQLYKVSYSLASHLGGGAAVREDGSVSRPTYEVGTRTHYDVGSAIGALNTSSITNATNIQNLKENALLWNPLSNTYTASSHGSSANKISNVAPGTLAALSFDAVNGSQLYNTNQQVTQNKTDISTLNVSLVKLNNDALLWDGSAEAFSASHGNSAVNKITNVALGVLAESSTDAVNGAQLYSTNQRLEQNTNLIYNLMGDTSETYITENGTGIKYVRTNDTGLVPDDAHASAAGATAVGYNAVASGIRSIAIGQSSISSVDSGIALGSGSVSARALVAGTQETHVNNGSLVVGYDTTDRTLLGALSLGTDDQSYRQITNVADGSALQDAVTIRQLQNAVGAISSAGSQYFHANSTLGDSLAVGENAIAVGPQTVVNGDAGIGIGFRAVVAQNAPGGIAIGAHAQANHANSVALGNGSQTTIGSQTSYTAYNMEDPQSSVGEIAIGDADNQRQITHVAAGTLDTDAVNVAQLKVTDSRVAKNTQDISSLSTQVVGIDNRVTHIENSVGDIVTTGNTKYFKANSTGAEASAQGQDSIAAGSGAQAAGEASLAIGTSSKATANNSVALGANSVADEADTVSVGSSKQQRRITNVSAGKNSTDAVNVAQLKTSESGSVRYGMNEDGTINYNFVGLGDGKGGTTRMGNLSAGVNDNDAVNYAQLKQSIQSNNDYTDRRMVEMDNKVNRVQRKMSGGIASAMAMTGLPQAYAPGASMTSLGGGTYHGETAVALGVSMVSASGAWVYKLQGSTNSQGDYSAAVGAGIQW
ncbi:YadA-like family protein [Pseudenterobacter timonensis]|uniref:YadA-like family protein n=1 Tax=Pseudenterobacter timonensis TaxID=1755099 RepID=A0AAE4DP97_9ENTR|nr:YadA-like family protein [Pseudenterobacter timonensis]MDR9891510.1 YadA-like family protein [Pseudenterobacter timonensis]